MAISAVGSNARIAEVPDLGQTQAEQARIDRAMDFFMAQGWTREQAAGIVGNLWAESRVKHDQAQHGGGPGYGLAQWEGPRQASFAQWAGHDIHNSTMQEQLEFIQWELTHTEAAAGRALRGADTADEAARIVMTRYERPADQSEGAQRGRAHYAEEIYGGSTGSPPPGNDGPNDPPSNPGPSNPGGDYTVRSGDTLSGIAQRHGVSLAELLRANPQIDNPNLIHPGQTIHLAGNDPGPASTYVVRSGDTLSGIAERHDVSLSALLAANPQFRNNPDLIHPGQTVRIPGGGGDSSTAPATHYTVRNGDTLSGIAERHGLTLDRLLAANPQFRSNPNLIYPGQSVRIPGGDGGTAPPDPDGNYTVRSGDTFSGIAGRHGLTVGELSRANPQIGNINLIHPGQNIRIPGGGGVEGPGGPGGPDGPEGPAGPNNNTAAQIAHEYLGWWAGDLKTSGHLPMNPNVPNDVCCANFVSAVLQEAGLIDFHTDLVTGSNSGRQGALGTELLERGWRRVPASQARPGDVAILNNGHHTELVYSNHNGDITLIGSNNTGGGSGPQQISYGNPYGNAWYLTPP